MGRKPSRNTNLPAGMRARHRPSGTYYYLDMGGKPRREIPLGSDYVLAMQKWVELRAHAHASQGKAVTFRDAAERYQREIIPRKARRTQRDNLAELAKLYEFFDSPPARLEDIEPIHIRQYLDWRVQETVARLRREGRTVTGTEGQVRANREKSLFSHIWNFARERGMTGKANPCAGVQRFRETARDTYVDDATYHAVWQEADAPTRDAMELAYLSGQRPADVLKLTWAHVHDGAIWLEQNKTGQRLRIAVQGQLADLIERLRKRRMAAATVQPMALVCSERGEALNTVALGLRFRSAREAALQKARKQKQSALAASIGAFQFRELRAKAGTDKEEREGMAAAKDQLGHADEQMTRRYVRHRKGKLVTPTR